MKLPTIINVRRFASVFALSLLVLPGLSACQTEKAGVTSTPTSASANVQGSPGDAVKAAKSVLKQMSLKPGDSTSTSYSGQVIAHANDGTRITISAKKYTDETSTVSVSIGGLLTQRPKLATKLVNGIQRRLNGSQNTNNANNTNNTNNANNKNNANNANSDNSENSMNSRNSANSNQSGRARPQNNRSRSMPSR